MADQSIPNLGRAWCLQCHDFRDIEDQFMEDTGDSRRITEVFSITVLTCGHTRERPVGQYPSPLQQAGPTPAMQHRPEGWQP